MEPLDPQDQALVLALQAEPRARAVQLGAVTGMSAPTVSNRLHALRDRGAIEVVGIIDYRALEQAYLAIVLAKGLSHEVLTGLPDRPGVVFAVQTIGAWDSAVCFVARDPLQMEVHLEWMRARSVAIEVETVLDIMVNGLSRQDPLLLRDALDDDIACLLAIDARSSFTAIAESLGIPEATARTRAQRMLDGHVVTPLVIPNPSLFGLEAAAAFGIEVHAPVAGVLDALVNLPGVITVLHTQGRYAAVVEVIAVDSVGVAAVRDQVLQVPGVRGVDVFTYGQRFIGRRPLPQRT